MVSEIFDAARWEEVPGFELTRHHLSSRRRSGHGADRLRSARGAQRLPPAAPSTSSTARSITRAGRPTSAASFSPGTGPRRRTAAGPSAAGATSASADATATATPRATTAGYDRSRRRTGRLHILEVQRLIRFMPKIVIAVVPGFAVGGGHSLHVVCDLTLASREHAVFKQTDTDVASFDGGYGSAYLAQADRPEVRARDLLPRKELQRRSEAHADGDGERASCPTPSSRRWRSSGPPRSTAKSPTAQRMAKFAMNLIDDGLVGQQVFAGEATRLAYMTDEAEEGRDAFLEKRARDFSRFPWHY